MVGLASIGISRRGVQALLGPHAEASQVRSAFFSALDQQADLAEFAMISSVLFVPSVFPRFTLAVSLEISVGSRLKK